MKAPVDAEFSLSASGMPRGVQTRSIALHRILYRLFRRLGEVLFRYLKIVFHGHALRVSQPRDHHLQRELTPSP